MSKYTRFTDSERKILIRATNRILKKSFEGKVTEENLRAAFRLASADKLGRAQGNTSNWVLVAFGVKKNLKISRPVPVIPGINDGADQWGKPKTYNRTKKEAGSRTASKIETAIQQIIARSGAKKADQVQKITAEVAKKMAENESMLAEVRKNQQEIKHLLKSIAQ